MRPPTHPTQLDDDGTGSEGQQPPAGKGKAGGRGGKKGGGKASSGGSGKPRKKSQEQMERRRERNRILARRTRLRKKFFFEVRGWVVVGGWSRGGEIWRPVLCITTLTHTTNIFSYSSFPFVFPPHTHAQSLQKQVMDLKRENSKLKTIVRSNMKEVAPDLLRYVRACALVCIED